jgi:aminoglycoside phosphotransferase family enzyme
MMIVQTALPPMIRALLQPAAYPHPAPDLQLHETHISWIILAGPFAYKLRKPVNLGFVDFTSAAARMEDCANEVRLNRRLCPDLYLGIVPIHEHDDRYWVGEPIRPDSLGQRLCPGEPAVWMRRLPAKGMLPAMLERNAATPELMREIARNLAAFHATAATGPGVDEYGSLATITANWDENFSQVAPFVGRTVPQELLDQIGRFVKRFLVEQRPLLELRVAERRIREGHGDLHAASICLDGDRLQLFDCLEFAPRFRCADVAAEVAFLAMDLDHVGRDDLAAAFVDEYVGVSVDRELLALLDFYRCYRAFVRGKVISLRLHEIGVGSVTLASLERQARSYFMQAALYAGRSQTGAAV